MKILNILKLLINSNNKQLFNNYNNNYNDNKNTNLKKNIFFKPNEKYKINQLNDIKKLYQNNNIIYPWNTKKYNFKFLNFKNQKLLNNNIYNKQINKNNINEKKIFTNKYFDKNKQYFYEYPKLICKNKKYWMIKENINNKLPLIIIKEIKSEKIKLFILGFLSLLGLLITSFCIILYFILLKYKFIIFFNITITNIAYPLFWIILFIIFFGILFSIILDFLRIKNSIYNYLVNTKINNNFIPYFLIFNYKKMIIKTIIFNWLGFSTYFFGIIVLSILYFFQIHTGEKFMFGFWSLGEIKDLSKIIIIIIIFIIFMLFLHIINAILIKKRKWNIINYYGREIISSKELMILKKKINRICLCIFVILIIILTLIISIPLLIIKYKNNHKK